ENTLLVKVENDFILMGSRTDDNETRFEGDKIYAATGVGYDDPEVGWHHCPPGMGIYQDMFVEIREPLFIHDVFVRPNLTEQRAEAWVEVWNCDFHPQELALRFSLYGQNFEQTLFENLRLEPSFTAQDGDTPTALNAEAGQNYFKLEFDLPDPHIWSPETPWLYQLQLTLETKGQDLDTATQQFGMRDFIQDEHSEPKGRFYLNGAEIRLRGANTMGHLQQCVFKKDWDQLIDDILLAKICNMNFLRLTQRPVQPEIYDYCDRLGLMTQTDLPLFAVLKRNQFCEAVRQAEEMERLVRPHACNIMVSYINEPFANGWNKPHRHLIRDELENFFTAASLVIRQANPERVIKTVDGDYDPPA
ncbi:glycoside hydrolase family 2, partial [bacterium]|nr:glycoside hydrolase family 2 [bacterium]